jgi:6-pyruvoyl-tetrahydropterin synthase
MGIVVKATKVYRNLPCAHAQWFDTNEDGSPGHCAQIHGYDRSVEFTFAGTPDGHGWIVPFGGLKPVKQFLEYYFDHVTVLPADDPRLEQLRSSDHVKQNGLLGTLRVLPYGVSMEMSSLFIWEHVNAYIYQHTSGRCWVERVRVYEHDRNDAMCEVDRDTAKLDAQRKIPSGDLLPMKPAWDWETPWEAMQRLNNSNRWQG